MAIKVMTERDWNKLRRKHVDAMGWGDEAGTDFWFYPGLGVTGSTTFLLSSVGWTTTSTGLTAGSGGDFMASADKGTIRSALTNAASDLVQSPAVFGDYQHAKVAQLIMGERVLPRYLIMDAFAAFTTASNNETASCLGFVEAGGSIVTANDAFATIFSDGTNFGCRSGGDTDAGAAVDTNPHWFRIILDRGSATSGAITDGAEWFIDGTSQGTIDIQADLSPMAFGMGIVSAGSNIIALGATHIYYEWNLANLDSLSV